MSDNSTIGLAAANNTTAPLGAGNATGETGAAAVNFADLILVSLAIFAASWAILIVIMYVLAPYFGRYADQRSRIIYSAVYTLPFAIIFALGLGGAMSLLSTQNFVLSLVIAFVIVFGLVMVQSYLLGWLTARGILKMESKSGSRNVKGGSAKDKAAKGKNVKGKRK